MPVDKRFRNSAVSQPWWIPYTPALTNLTLSNGTMTAAVAIVNKVATVRIRIVFGSSTAVTGPVSIGLPFTSSSTIQIMTALIGASGSTVPLAGVGYIPASSSAVQPFHATNTTTTTQVQLGTVALTLGTNSSIMLQGTVEIA